MAGHLGHLIDVLVLVLHGCAHGRVSHDIHDRKQVFGCTVHLSSKAMTRTVEDEVIWHPGLLPGFRELFGDRLSLGLENANATFAALSYCSAGTSGGF